MFVFVCNNRIFNSKNSYLIYFLWSMSYKNNSNSSTDKSWFFVRNLSFINPSVTILQINFGFAKEIDLAIASSIKTNVTYSIKGK